MNVEKWRWTRIPVASTAVIAAAIALTVTSDEDLVSPYQPTTETEALASMNNGGLPNEVWNGGVVVPSGTHIYASPFDQNPASVVEAGELVVSQRPRLLNLGGVTFLGMVDNGKGATTGQATDPERTRWVSMEELLERPGYQSLAYDGYDPANNDGRSIPLSLPVGVTPDDNLRVPGKDGAAYQRLATVSTIPTDYLGRYLANACLISSQIDPWAWGP